MIYKFNPMFDIIMGFYKAFVCLCEIFNSGLCYSWVLYLNGLYQ